VDGYNVYRFDPNWGRFDPLNNAPIDALQFMDTTAESGVKYWYFVTVVSYSGLAGSYMQSPASDLVSGTWGTIALWMPDYNGVAGDIVRLRVSVADAWGLLSTDMKIRVTYDPSLLEPWSEVSTNDTVEKTVLTRDMSISYGVSNSMVYISASNPVSNHATLRILGCNLESSPNHPISISAKYNLDGGVDWDAINGYQNVNNGQQYRMDLGSLTGSTNAVLNVKELDTGIERRSDDASDFIKVYHGGDTLSILGVTDRDQLVSCLRPMVDTNLTVIVATNEVLYLFEMSATTNGGDWQDVIGYVEYNEGVSLKGEGHLFDILFQVKAGALTGSEQTNTFDYVLLKDQSGNALTVDYTDEAVFTVTNAYMLGDVNGDGLLTISGDFTLAMQIAVGHIVPTADQILAGDIDGDGVITKLDATLIRRIMLGLPVNETGMAPPALIGEGYVLSLGSFEGQTNGLVTVPLLIDKTIGVASVDARISYNSYLLTLQSVTNGPLTGDYGFASKAGDGYVDILISAPLEIVTSNGILAYLEFLVKPAAGIGTMSELSITRSDLGGTYGGKLDWKTGVTESNGVLWVVYGGGDSDGDGLTDYQEQHFDGSALYDPAGTDTDVGNPDTDGDRMKDGDEVRAGTSPLDSLDLLQMRSLTVESGNGFVVSWQSVEGMKYTISWATNLTSGFSPLVTNVTGLLPDNVHTDIVSGANSVFYRIDLEE